VARRRRDPMRAEERTSVVFVLPPGGVTPWFAEHLGTAYLRAVLARAGIASAQYLPPRNPSLAGFARALRERRPALVGFTAYESNLRTCRAMARVVRETLPDAVVAVGGPNATFSPEETLELLGADVCLRGAGEGTIAAIAEAVLGAGSPRRRLPDLLAAVPNLVLATGDGVRHTRLGDLSSFPAERFGCMDDLPSPYQAGLVETADVGIMTARGCNQHCTYCSFAAISGRKVHFHSAERVLEDLAAYKAVVERVERRRPTVSILDDAFTLAPRRARELCEGIVARRLQLPFDCETRADRVDLELLRLMRRAGVTVVSFGLESAVPRVLRAMGKVQHPASPSDPGFERERAFLEALRRAVGWAKEAGLTPAVSVIGGHPGETADDFRATLAFVDSLDVPVYAHNVLSVLPGTPLHDARARHGLAVARDDASGEWRTRHGYDVHAVAPLPSSTAHQALREEANEVSDAICGRPRPARAAGGTAWAVVLHEEGPARTTAAWLREVLAVSGAVVVWPGGPDGGPADTDAWLRTLAEEDVPWGTFALLHATPGSRGRVRRSAGTAGEHRFEVHRRWPAGGRVVEACAAGDCRVPLWFASRQAPPSTARTRALVPQVVDGCRWWSGWRRCRQPAVLHVFPDGAVRACWNGPVVGRVGEPYATLAARGATLSHGRARAGDRCPLEERTGRGSGTAKIAEALEIAARTSWLFAGAARRREDGGSTPRRRA
jgi:anaerobic magnesium-protoporphyrin IX monomethyl ester cyclase